MFLQIKDYEGIYKVSEDGKIFTWDNVEKKQTLGKRKYFVVSLWKNNKRKTVYVHRIVAQAFLKNPQNKKYINHKDGNKQNNQITNLEWVTAGENKSHSFKVLGERHWNKDRFGWDSPYSKPIEMIDLKTGVVVNVFGGVSEAARIVNTSQGNISMVCAGKRKSAASYGWRYKND